MGLPISTILPRITRGHLAVGRRQFARMTASEERHVYGPSTMRRTFAVQKAVDLGGDADSIGAVCGQLAGAYWDQLGIPIE